MSRRRANVKIARPNGVVQRVNCCLLTVTLCAATGLAVYGQQTASLTLSGTVNRTVAVTVTPRNNYNSLDLVNGETEKTVAVINERSNDKAGYTVTLASIGAGSTDQAQLRASTPGNSDTIPYSLKYGGTGVALIQGKATLTAAGGRTSSAGNNNVLTITIPSSAGVNADTYADTLQLTIQGN